MGFLAEILDRVSLSNLLLFIPVRPKYGWNAEDMLVIPAAETKGELPYPAVCRFKQSTSGSPVLLVALHGQSGDIYKSNFCFASAITRTADPNILAIEYPGYGVSPGVPSERSVVQLVDCALRTFLARASPSGTIPWSQVVVCGRSMGSGPATLLASRYNPAGLMLVSPFTAVNDVANHKAPKPLRGAAHALFSPRFRNIDKIQTFDGPTFILHGEKDRLIPISQAEELHAASSSDTKVLSRDRTGTHTSLDGTADSVEFLLQVSKSLRKKGQENLVFDIPASWKAIEEARKETRRYNNRWRRNALLSILTCLLLANNFGPKYTDAVYVAAQLAAFVSVSSLPINSVLRFALILTCCGVVTPLVAAKLKIVGVPGLLTTCLGLFALLR